MYKKCHCSINKKIKSHQVKVVVLGAAPAPRALEKGRIGVNGLAGVETGPKSVPDYLGLHLWPLSDDDVAQRPGDGTRSRNQISWLLDKWPRSPKIVGILTRIDLDSGVPSERTRSCSIWCCKSHRKLCCSTGRPCGSLRPLRTRTSCALNKQCKDPRSPR